MVRLTLRALSHLRNVPGLKSGLPGTTVESLKHNYSNLPVYVFTTAGGIVCGLYLLKLALYKDTRILKGTEFKDINPDAKVPLILTSEVVHDLQGQKIPEKRPEVKVGEKYED